MQQLRNFLRDGGQKALEVLAITEDELIEALEALTDVLIKYNNIPDKTWAFLCMAVADGMKGRHANTRTDLG